MRSMRLFAVGVRIPNLSLNEIRTLVFVTLVFSGSGVIYLIRERDHFWRSAPRRWLIVASLADLTVVTILATRGILIFTVPNNLWIGWTLVRVVPDRARLSKGRYSAALQLA